MQTSRLKTATNFLVAHLAFTDLGNCAICFPTFIPALLGNDYLFKSLHLCKIQFYLASIFSSQSAVMLNVIALNRYCLVTKKIAVYRKLFNAKATAVTVAVLWVLNTFVILLPELGFGNVVPVPPLHTCLMEPGDPMSWLLWTLLVCVSIFLCYLAIPLFYFRTFAFAKRSKQKVINHLVVRPGMTDNNASLAHQTNERSRQTCRKAELRYTMVSALVYCTFTICWTPFCIVHLVNRNSPVASWVYHYCFLLIYTNSCLNPFIYAGLNRNFRRKIKQLLRLEVD